MAAPTPETLRLYCEVFWGQQVQDAVTLGRGTPKLMAGANETAALRLYNFTLPGEQDFEIAAWEGESVRVFIPPSAEIELRKMNDGFRTAKPDELQLKDGQRTVLLTAGMAARLREKQMVLVCELAPDRTVNSRDQEIRGIVYALLAIVMFLVGPMVFFAFKVDPLEAADYAKRTLIEARQKEVEKLNERIRESDAKQKEAATPVP